MDNTRIQILEKQVEQFHKALIELGKDTTDNTFAIQNVKIELKEIRLSTKYLKGIHDQFKMFNEYNRSLVWESSEEEE